MTTRILIGHGDTELPDYDRERFDVQVVRHTPNGSRIPQTIAEMLAQCPPDWKPDVYYHAALVHFPIPTDIEAFDGLTATNIQDWHRGGRAVWAGVGFFDVVVTELNAQRLLQASGYENAVFGRLWGANPQVHRVIPGVERDIDILFIGSLEPAVWEERNRWLDRLAALSDRYKVLITAGHFGEDYVRLTNRAKIVFNRSVNGCTNQRAYDGLACGALVFNEDDNEETHLAFDDGVHCVYYNDENFEARLDYYLTHADERQRIVDAGRELVLARHTEAAHFNGLLETLTEHVGKPRYRPCAALPKAERNGRKAMQMYACARPASAQTAMELLQEVAEELDKPRYLEALAALHGWPGHYATGKEKTDLLTVAIHYARQALRAESRFAQAQMTFAFLLLERAEATQGAHPAGRNDVAEAALALAAAAELCEAALREADEQAAFGDIEGLGYPRWNDLFDSRIERAYLLRGVDRQAWAREMRATIAWRCRSLLSDLAAMNGQQEEALQQAERAAQNLPLEADALLRWAHHEAVSGELQSAARHYLAGLKRTPLAAAYWPELATVLRALGLREDAEAFVQERLRVIKAIPAFAGMRPALLAALEMAGG